MAVIGTEDGHTFPTEVAWERITDSSLIELAYVARDMGNSQSWDSERAAATSRAYHALAEAATALRLIRHGNDRLREHRQAAEAQAEKPYRLEQAIEAVLVKYGVPAVLGDKLGVDGDRGDFASDLADAARQAQ